MGPALRGRAQVVCCLLVFGLQACASGSSSDGVSLSGVDAVGVLDAGLGAGEGGGGGEGDSRDAGETRDARPAGPLPRDPNDVDGDHARGGVDCSDADDTVYPGASELCDGKDNDCDGFVDTFAVDGRTYHPDRDGDGLGDAALSVRSCENPPGWVLDGSDCDDEVPQQSADGDICVSTELPVVYVAKHGHDDNAGDAPMRAVRTIERGIARALSCPGMRCSVLIAEGTYEEAVQLVEGVDLFGGYGPDFTVRDSTSHSVVITSQQARTVTAAGLTAPTRLDGLMIQGAFLSGSDGESSYGLTVVDCADRLTLSNVVVRAGRGADGASGVAGTPQTCDARGGQGGTSFDCGASAGGVGDAGGDSASSGGGGQGGKSNCPSACPLAGSDGITSGDSGEPGSDGTDGEAGEPVSDALGSWSNDAWQGLSGGDGQRGAHGTGGGGGGAGGTKRIRACFGCGTIFGGRGGDGAPGGCGGGGGRGGQPGGAAIALAAVRSAVAVADVILLGGVGGNGGAGGHGVAGEPGGLVTGKGHEGVSSNKCGAIRYYSGAGGIGGVGGAGGAGAGGAGGIGGAAITVALVGGASLTERGALQIEAGLGGGGGAAGGGPGRAGGLGKSGAQVTKHVF